ncbi:MAG: ABC transporter ATP-binding protein [Kovacikia sp.]
MDDVNSRLPQLPLVEVVDLCFRHPGRAQPTIAGVHLTLYPGEIVLIAGATGSGKSTLLNCLSGIAPNHTGGDLLGKILFQGADITRQPVRQRSRSLGTLLQNVEVQIFTDRVWEELAFGLENWNFPSNQIPPLIDASLQTFELQAQRDWLIQQLSAGQKQRLLLACLLTIGQPVLMLDEPLAYLDSKGVEQLLQLLRSRADQGQSVLLIEHRLDAVKAICDRAYYFDAGQLVAGCRQGWQGLGQEQEEATTPLFAPSVRSLPRSPASLLLQTHQLSWGGYPPFPDLQVKPGEIVLLKGDNGCGKTTLLKLLSGLLKPTTGRWEILGRDMGKRSVADISRQIGFVLQNPNHQLFADSVRAEIWQPGVSSEIADTLLDRLNLSKLADRHPQSLSQGQKRRLALGAVLARQPEICLLDEITVGQDPHSLSLMLRVLRDFTSQANALILTSHDPLTATVLNARLVQIGAASPV